MTTYSRQHPSRFDEIDVGDTLTWVARQGWRWPTPQELRDGADELSQKWGKLARNDSYPSAKALEKIGDGWRVRYGPKGRPPVIVTRETFWALRKAPGRGGTAPRRDGERECQVCGRVNLLANTGRIPHHGYERPGWGYQTPSCAGSLELPYAESRDVLPDVISFIDSELLGFRRFLAVVNAGDEPIPDPRTSRGLDDDGKPFPEIDPSDVDAFREAQAQNRTQTQRKIKSRIQQRVEYQRRFDQWYLGIGETPRPE